MCLSIRRFVGIGGTLGIAFNFPCSWEIAPVVNDSHSQWQGSPYVQCAKQLNRMALHLGPRENIIRVLHGSGVLYGGSWGLLSVVQFIFHAPIPKTLVNKHMLISISESNFLEYPIWDNFLLPFNSTSMLADKKAISTTLRAPFSKLPSYSFPWDVLSLSTSLQLKV